jgi:hypothetical protein
MESEYMIRSERIANKNIVIYGFGITGKWLSTIFEGKFFIDTDIKKWGDSFNGISVFSPEKLSHLNPNTDIVLVSVVDIFDVIPLLNYYGVSWISLSEVMSGQPLIIEKNITNESDDFLRYSVETVLKCQDAYLSEDQFYLRSVDLVITEKCTLKCKDCANLMQFYETPVNYGVESIVNGLVSLAASTNFIHEVRVIGGEPFLNKDIYEVLDKISNIDNINKIIIYTNGMIPPKEDFVSVFDKNKIIFSITDYAELGRNLEKTKAILDKYAIPYRIHPPEHWTDSGRILDTKINSEDAKELFAKCCGKNLYTLIGEKLYRCPFAANADQLKAIPDHESNYVDVNNGGLVIKEFSYGIDSIDACAYCPGRSFDSPIIKPALQTKQPIPYKKFVKIELSS